ncbi:MAG: MBL fold metallo-hydrolase [Ruminococcaceae bacterium]|jgi:competence protein ComEC|nr:MBL fold metallo-hydrolase [Oscillospiraceae bacterium]
MGMMMKKKRKTKRGTDSRIDTVNRISLLLLILSLGAVYCINAIRVTGTLTPTMELLDGHAAVRFVDVGQGDCTLVVHGGHAVLVDAGSAWDSDAAAEYVRAYAPKIDAFFVTHPHEDHMGGAEAVLNACRVGTLYLSEAVSHEAFYEETLAAAQKRKTDLVRLAEGGEYLFGDIRVELYDVFGYPYEDLNDASLLLRVSVDGLSVFIGGDAERGLEGYAVEKGFDLSAGIYQVNHHGSSSSTTEAFLDRVAPSTAVISCGRNNFYGHPSRDVLDRLAERGIEVRRTDREGTVVIRGGS